MFQFILQRIFKEIIDGKEFLIHGLLPHIPDPRDFKYFNLGGVFDYKPKHGKMELPILEIKNQLPNNTCVFHSYASCRENDERAALSPRSLVVYAKSKGYLSSNGISSIRNGQKAGVEFGIAEESLVSNDNLDWQTYSNLSLTQEIIDNASKHKAKSYFWVNSKNEYLKALDEGHPIHTGFDWYSSYNMYRGGFSAPWILPWRKGYKVGGHAVACIGYDIPQGLLIFQNSFGKEWGDNGKFYVRMADFFHENIQGAVTVDLDGETLDTFINSHEGKDVKADGNPAIYRIENGKKRPFPNEEIFRSWNESGLFERVSQSLLDKIPNGEMMPLYE